jgi:hypothetical protein
MSDYIFLYIFHVNLLFPLNFFFYIFLEVKW